MRCWWQVIKCFALLCEMRAESKSVHSLVQSNINIMNLSRTYITISVLERFIILSSSSVTHVRYKRAPVNWRYEFHVDQADFLPLPCRQDTVSQPVSAWKAGSAAHFLGPIAALNSRMGIKRTCFRTPKCIHSSVKPSEAKKMLWGQRCRCQQIELRLYWVHNDGHDNSVKWCGCPLHHDCRFQC